MRSLGILLLVPALFGFALTGCSAPESTQKQELDDAIHGVEQALGRYMSTDPQGPASQLERVTDRVVSAWDGVRSAAEGLDEVDLAAAEAALAELVDTVERVPEDLTAREGFELIEPVVEAFEAEVDEIHDSLDMH